LLVGGESVHYLQDCVSPPSFETILAKRFTFGLSLSF